MAGHEHCLDKQRRRQHLQLLFKLGRILSQRRVEQTATIEELKTAAAGAAAGAMKMATSAAMVKIHIVLGRIQGHIRCLNV